MCARCVLAAATLGFCAVFLFVAVDLNERNIWGIVTSVVKFLHNLKEKFKR
jgi:hypothetical protein